MLSDPWMHFSDAPGWRKQEQSEAAVMLRLGSGPECLPIVRLGRLVQIMRLGEIDMKSYQAFVGLLFALVFAACASTTAVASGDDAGETVASEQEVVESPEELAGPPPIVLVNTENSLTLDAWAYCWTFEEDGICADGEAPDPAPDAGTAMEPIEFEFMLDDWNFNANVISQDGSTSTEVGVTGLGDGLYQFDAVENPPGPIVEIFGRGEQGDVIVTFSVDL